MTIGMAMASRRTFSIASYKGKKPVDASNVVARSRYSTTAVVMGAGIGLLTG